MQLNHICQLRVLPEWTDYNGHMNVAYYTLAFDQAVDILFEQHLSMGEEYIKTSHTGPFALQSAYCYLAELKEKEEFDFSVQILDYDEKRLHFFGRMRRLRDNVTAATCETLYMNVDHQTRRTTPYAPDIYKHIVAVHKQTVEDALPAEVGKLIRIRRKPNKEIIC